MNRGSIVRCVIPSVESQTRTYHERIGSGRTAGRRGEAGQDGTPTEQFALETTVPRTSQGIEDMSPERTPEARTIEILCKPNAGKK